MKTLHRLNYMPALTSIAASGATGLKSVENISASVTTAIASIDGAGAALLDKPPL